jgi:hypothetical protein
MQDETMKHKLDFDPEILIRQRRRCSPIHSIGQLMVIVAVSALILSAVAAAARHLLLAPSPAGGAPLVLRAGFSPVAVAGGAGGALQAEVFLQQPSDPFVIVAPQSIDLGMVVWAPEWIDPDMIVTARAPARQRGRGDLMLGR